VTIFLSLHFVTEQGQNAVLLFHLFLVLCFSLILEHFCGSVSVCQQSLSYVQSSIFWLDRVSYRN
jgi:hypothetical protein